MRVVIVYEGHFLTLVRIAATAELLHTSHEGAVVDERLIDLILASVETENKALGGATVKIVGTYGELGLVT